MNERMANKKTLKKTPINNHTPRFFFLGRGAHFYTTKAASVCVAIFRAKQNFFFLDNYLHIYHVPIFICTVLPLSRRESDAK
jgi:hypothetical protein